MKIAVFYNLAFGGAKRVVQEHVKGLVGLGHTVDVYTTDQGSDIFDPGKYASSVFVYPQVGEKNILSRSISKLETGNLSP